jgi:LacI family transcriptional regulator
MTKLIALVYDNTAAPLLHEVQRGMTAAIAGSAFAVAVCAIETAQPVTELLAFLQAHDPAGVLLLPPLAEDPALLQLCDALGVSFMTFGADTAADAHRVIASDDRQAAAKAVAYLAALGHERIGMITGPEESRIAQQRELGYLDAMADHDLDRGPALIASGDHSFESGQAAALLLLEVSPRPTAIFAGSDEMAAGARQVAARKNIPVPQALSIIGFGDIAIAEQLSPPLTTVHIPLAEMALAATARLMNADGAASLPSRFTPDLVVRGSVGGLPGLGETG